MPSFKDNLIAEFGEAEATRILSERNKRAASFRTNLRAKGTPGPFNDPEFARKAQLKSAASRKAKNEDSNSGHSTDPQ